MTYKPDPGGHFQSDVHRRVLGHLSLPTDGHAWSVPALLSRMATDIGTDINDPAEMQSILESLEEEALARKHQSPNGDIWQMTEEGFKILTGPIANEPPADSTPDGPAVINALGATTISATQITAEVTDAADHPA